mgnify:CR=1 FL=1
MTLIYVFLYTMFSKFMNQVKEFTSDKTGQSQMSLGYGANNKYPEFNISKDLYKKCNF